MADRCCERDHNADGHCDRHPEGRGPLTPAERFVAKRVKDKIGSIMHNLADAISAARSLTPDVHAEHNFPAAMVTIERRVAELRSVVEGRPTTKPEGGSPDGR